MSPIDIAILILTVGFLLFLLFRIGKNRRRNNGGCHGCGHCPYAGQCEKQESDGTDTEQAHSDTE